MTCADTHHDVWWHATKEQKAFTFRLDADLEAVAAANGVSVAAEIRQAVANRIEARSQDPAFQEWIRSIIEQNQRVLERLAE